MSKDQTYKATYLISFKVKKDSTQIDSTLTRVAEFTAPNIPRAIVYANETKHNFANQISRDYNPHSLKMALLNIITPKGNEIPLRNSQQEIILSSDDKSTLSFPQTPSPTYNSNTTPIHPIFNYSFSDLFYFSNQ